MPDDACRIRTCVAAHVSCACERLRSGHRAQPLGGARIGMPIVLRGRSQSDRRRRTDRRERRSAAIRTRNASGETQLVVDVCREHVARLLMIHHASWPMFTRSDISASKRLTEVCSSIAEHEQASAGRRLRCDALRRRFCHAGFGARQDARGSPSGIDRRGKPRLAFRDRRVVLRCEPAVSNAGRPDAGRARTQRNRQSGRGFDR